MPIGRKQKPQCRVEGCPRPAKGPRGVCKACYATLARRVRLGEATWVDLEAAGVVLPPHANALAPASRAIAGLNATPTTEANQQAT